ncbi:hypothetical protein [Oleiharenicola lentus]|uniref:hypothetical protein n=1 Tax=Oleiharenicola lentus TaxID=2508720 RepID=UPI003F660F37
MDNPSTPPGNPPKTASFPPPLKVQGGPPGSGLVKFPPKGPAVGGLKPLVLPRRFNPLQRAQEATQATSAVRRTIGELRQSQAPWGGNQSPMSTAQVDELEKTLRSLETKVGEQEMALADAQNKLADRDRALAEAEALLQAREKVIEAMRIDQASNPPVGAAVAVSSAEVEALKKLKEELDRQEASLKEQRAAIKEREIFIEQSEASLFEKMQAQQEKETELEQKSEDVKRAMLRAGLIKAEPLPPMEKA